jgi:hypothetical protein
VYAFLPSSSMDGLVAWKSIVTLSKSVYSINGVELSLIPTIVGIKLTYGSTSARYER